MLVLGILIAALCLYLVYALANPESSNGNIRDKRCWKSYFFWRSLLS